MDTGIPHPFATTESLSGEPQPISAAPPPYPFTAIVGQDELKTALLIAAINPRVGGVLILGQRGTGKSTIVRALAGLLPPVTAVAGCRYGCDPAGPLCDECRADPARPARRALRPVPVVDLPLGVTADRLTGSLDLEQALGQGVRAYEPGLLARANRGFLYIDEVNLLEDHLVDLLLDVAASGVNIVEREGLSVRHPARFVLAGSANPEEGELRPQLLDRFGLLVRVETITDLDQRVEIVRRREAYERDPGAFARRYAPAQRTLARQVRAAQKALARVAFPDSLLRDTAALCRDLDVDGHRGEITIVRAASALAALEGRATATAAGVRRVAVPALRHRLRRGPLDPLDGGERVAEVLDRIFPA
ncbi:MAG TPA: magnesium chelatase ATPase subunit I [Chloroflexia bacterium]|jgi:magnesium chelatase subunit I|nr:magnesium chelatase ATPase subunit I [Chloroflexia bacterium]